MGTVLPEALGRRADSMESLHRRCRVLRLDSDGVPDSRLSVRCFSAMFALQAQNSACGRPRRATPP